KVKYKSISKINKNNIKTIYTRKSINNIKYIII
ncbi:hypothetical protein FPSE_06506, partial [Fusarium pseudograminearum CS3096]